MKINWGKALIIFFIIFFVWVFLFVRFAMRQSIDLVSEDYYQKGAKYIDQIHIDQRSAAYQDSLQITGSAGQLQITLSKGMATGNDSIFVYFFRPSDKTKDQRFGFRRSESPITIDKKSFVHGRYQVFLTWSMNKEKYSIGTVVDIE